MNDQKSFQLAWHCIYMYVACTYIGFIFIFRSDDLSFCHVSIKTGIYIRKWLCFRNNISDIFFYLSLQTLRNRELKGIKWTRCLNGAMSCQYEQFLCDFWIDRSYWKYHFCSFINKIPFKHRRSDYKIFFH